MSLEDTQGPGVLFQKTEGETQGSQSGRRLTKSGFDRRTHACPGAVQPLIEFP
jgi:hypothetical protein